MQPEQASDSFDISRLISPKCFQPIPHVNIPQQFKLSDDKLEPYDLDTLVEKKFYIEAAKLAQKQLIQHTTNDFNSIFHLWYIRLSCLVLAKLSSIARDEASFLGDFGSTIYRNNQGECIVPWKLRLLVVPLQSRGNNQIGLNRYYSLRREALYEAHKSKDHETKQEWTERILVLGFHVGSMLVGMKDYFTAIDHFRSMYSSTETDSNALFKKYHSILGPVIALVYLQIGDTLSARQWFAVNSSNQARTAFYASLCSIADKDLPDAENTLSSIKIDADSESLRTGIENNLALVKLQEGNVTAALEHLEKLIENGCVDHNVLFNLFTIYDLQKINPDSKKNLILEKIKDSGIESLGSYEFIHI